MKTERNSSIELLKLIAMIMIVISHSLPRYGAYESYIDFSAARMGFSNLILYVFYYFGQIGNAIFIVCSSWFLLESNKTKLEKIRYIYADTFLFSILWLVIVVLLGFNVSAKLLVKSLLPVLCKNNWFISCYIIFYLLHPLLNFCIKRINQRQHLSVVLFGGGIYSVLATLWSDTYYYTYVVGFILLYLIVAYIKLYAKEFSDSAKYNRYVLIAASCVLVMLISFTQFLGTRLEFFSNQMLKWNCFNNPLIILIAVALLNLFKAKNFFHRGINEVMSVSLLIYIIHENILFREYIKPLWWQWVYENYSYRYIIVWVLLFTGICFLVSALAACCYKFCLRKHIYNIATNANIFALRIYNLLIDKLVKIK